MKRAKPSKASVPPTESGPAFRSAAVARMANMPVATLRIWEQRYQAVQPATAASGRRLYSPADVQRVLLLRRLTEQGHAIGAIAALSSAQLEQLSLDVAAKATAAGRGFGRALPPLRWVVVGPALAARLERPAFNQHRGRSVRRIAVFDSLAEAALSSLKAGADWLVWHAPELSPELPPELAAAQQACRARQVVVVYRFAGAAAIKVFADAGAIVIREPADDETLSAALAAVEAGVSARAVEPPASWAAQPPAKVAPRRFDDAALTAIAGLPPTVACECPRHVAELLMQLSSFETYSAGCIHRSERDAQLHAYLQQVAGAARMLFETALERVAQHERLPLR